MLPGEFRNYFHVGGWSRILPHKKVGKMVWEQKQHPRELCCGGKQHREEQKEAEMAAGPWLLMGEWQAGVAREERKGQMKKTAWLSDYKVLVL